MTRCEWCGRFVAKATELERWRSEDAWGKWHEHAKLLCPQCAKSNVELPWWKPISATT